LVVSGVLLVTASTFAASTNGTPHHLFGSIALGVASGGGGALTGRAIARRSARRATELLEPGTASATEVDGEHGVVSQP
jgi:hypothetical protein